MFRTLQKYTGGMRWRHTSVSCDSIGPCSIAPACWRMAGRKGAAASRPMFSSQVPRACRGNLEARLNLSVKLGVGVKLGVVGHLDGARFEWKVLFAGEREVSAQTLRQNMNEPVRVV